MPRRIAARSSLRPFSFAAVLLAAGAAHADGSGGPPSFLTLLDHGSDISVDPEWRVDGELQARLDEAVADAGLSGLARSGKLGVALVDLADVDSPRLAEVNGARTMYAASVPKIGVLYAAFQAQSEGRLELDRPTRRTLEAMIRVSSNQAASDAIQALGFNYINSVLWQSGLFDPETGGGLWIGKAYGGENDRWHRDPVANTSHGASALSLAMLLTELAQGDLIDEKSSREMLAILGSPGLHHKFVRGIERCDPEAVVCRKSGTWSRWHGDAALIESERKRYAAVALVESGDGNRLLEDLIVALDACIERRDSLSPDRALLASAAVASLVTTPETAAQGL